MWNEKKWERKVAVAIDKNKGSKGALKWALDNILTKSQTVSLIHVNQTPIPPSLPSNAVTPPRSESSNVATDIFLPFSCFCSRREVLWESVTLDEKDIAKALIDYVCFNRINTLVLGAHPRNSISRLFKTNIPSVVLKGAPSFCNVYIISKTKVAFFRAASVPISKNPAQVRRRSTGNFWVRDDFDSRASNVRPQDEWSMVAADQNSYITQGRMSTESDIFSFYNNLGSELESHPPRSFSVGRNFDPLGYNSTLSDIDAPISSVDNDNRVLPLSMPSNEEFEEKTIRLQLQMKQTMDMYHAACKEALAAKQKAREFQLLKIENEKRLLKAEKAKQEALATMEEEKCKGAYKVAKAASQSVEKEKQKRLEAEMKASRVLLLRQQSLFHIVVVFFLFYVYFF